MPHQTIARQSILVALAALTPIPFVDTWLQDRLRAEMTRGLAHHHSTVLDDQTVSRLSSMRGNLLVGCMLGVVWWPIKKLLRKIVYILAIKDAIDCLADTIIRGLMLDAVFARGRGVGDGAQVRAAMDTAMTEHARSPLWGTCSPSTSHTWEHMDRGFGRVLVWVARRGGADPALDHFRALLNEPTAQA